MFRSSTAPDDSFTRGAVLLIPYALTKESNSFKNLICDGTRMRWGKMPDTSSRRLIRFTILFLFTLFVAITIILIMTGVMWYPLSHEQLVFWLTIDTSGGSLAAGIVFIYSLERYKQEHLFTDFLLVMLSITAIFTGMLYLITSPAFQGLSPFAERNRNRVILMFQAIVMAVSPLLGSLRSEEPIQRREKRLLVLMNGFVGPILALYALFSQTQLITLSSSDYGPFQFTPGGLIAFSLLYVLLALSLFKLFRAYLVTQVNVHLAVGLLFALFMIAGLLISMTTNPLSVLEGAWYTAYIEGFAIIGISFMMDVVVDPFRALKKLVIERTEELAESKRESEYYLNIWSHKVGNLLQGLHMYLELVMSAPDQKEVRELSRSSLMLVDDVDAINKQVRILSRIKSKQAEDLVPVSMKDAIKSAIDEIDDILGENAPEIVFVELERDDHVLADDLLSTIPFNIIMYIVRNLLDEESRISVDLSESPDHLTVNIRYVGKHISKDVLAFHHDSLDPSRTTLGLDIYAVNVLLKSYGGSFFYEDLPHGGQFTASMKRYLTRTSQESISESAIGHLGVEDAKT